MGKVQRWDGSGPLCVGVELLILPELAIRHTQVAAASWRDDWTDVRVGDRLFVVNMKRPRRHKDRRGHSIWP